MHCWWNKILGLFYFAKKQSIVSYWLVATVYIKADWDTSFCVRRGWEALTSASPICSVSLIKCPPTTIYQRDSSRSTTDFRVIQFMPFQWNIWYWLSVWNGLIFSRSYCWTILIRLKPGEKLMILYAFEIFFYFVEKVHLNTKIHLVKQVTFSCIYFLTSLLRL